MSEEESQSYNQQNDEQYENRNDNANEQGQKLPYVVPSSKIKLRACIHCRLIKAEQQWKSTKNCENCGAFNNMQAETTDKFSGQFVIIKHIISIINDFQSWVRRKKKLGRPKLVLGAYAIKLNN